MNAQYNLPSSLSELVVNSAFLLVVVGESTATAAAAAAGAVVVGGGGVVVSMKLSLISMFLSQSIIALT